MERSLTKIRDIDLKILEELNDKELFNFCLTSKYGRELCNDNNFWRSRFEKRFGKHWKRESRSWKDFYLKIIYYTSKYKHLGHYDVYMQEAAEDEGMKNLDLIEYFISQGGNNYNWGLIGAARKGDKELVDYFISKGANVWDKAMEAAAGGGHRNLVEFFISKGARNWDYGMRYAIRGEHRDLVDFFISKGANDWRMGRQAAREVGDWNLAAFFESKMK